MSHLSKITCSTKQGTIDSSPLETRGKKRDREELEAKAFHLFSTLLPELQIEVFSQIPRGDPTRFSLAFTCKKNYQQFFHVDPFDPYQFADGCASLGYGDLLRFAVEAGGPLDHRTVCFAVKRGYFFKELFKRFYQETISKYAEADAKRSFFAISTVAAESGNVELANRLRRLFKDVRMEAKEQLDHLIAGGRRELALRVNSRLSSELKLQKLDFYNQFLVCAIRRGNLDATLLAFRELSSLVSPDILRGNEIQCIVEGVKHGKVGFLKLWNEKTPLSQQDLTWLFRNIFDSSQISSTSDYFECLVYLKSMGFFRPVRLALTSIPIWADVKALDWMVENEIIFDAEQALDNYLLRSPRTAKFEVVKWALDQKMLVKKRTLWAGALSGQAELFNFLWVKKDKTLSLPPHFLVQVANIICKAFAAPAFATFATDPTYLQKRIRIYHYRKGIQMLLEKGCEWGPVNETYHQLAVLLYRKNKLQAQRFVKELKMPVDAEFFASQEDRIPADWF